MPSAVTRVESNATTDPSQFYRRGWHSSVLLGDTLFIDGGEFSVSTTSGVANYPYNLTYAIDLSSSWSPSTVSIQRIAKNDAPVFNTPNLWPASDNKSFYLFNGDITLAGGSIANPPSTPELWQFTTSSATTGSWNRVGYATTLMGTTRAKSAYGGNSVYILGGFSFDRTDSRAAVIGRSDGLISYNMQSGQWQNQSISNYAPSGWWLDGHMHYVSSLGGSNGILLAFGGVTNADTFTPVSQSFVSFGTIGVYNPDLNQWRNQTTYGDIPSSRREACSQGVAGDNGTFEIFVHGGSAYTNSNPHGNATLGNLLDQVWILSLPSFTWYRSTAYTPTNARYAHTCHIPGNPPRSQLISIGGVTPDIDGTYESRDSHPQGLGILDLNTLQWVNSYNASAKPYKTPAIVRNGISANGSLPAQWDSSDTPIWLTGKTAAQLQAQQPKTSSGNGNGNNSGGSSTTNPSPAVNRSGLASGAIAGIVVVGAILLLLIAYIFLARRFSLWLPAFLRRRKGSSAFQMGEKWEKPELAGALAERGRKAELDSSVEVREMDSRQYAHVHEAGADRVRYEMIGSIPQHELGGRDHSSVASR